MFSCVEISHFGLIARDVALGDVGVNFIHRAWIRPAADLHGDLLRHPQMVGKRCKAVAKAVDAYVGEAVSDADLVDVLTEPVLGDVHHRTGWFPLPLDRLFQ